MTEHTAARDEWKAWCEERTRAVTAVPGNLALVSYQPVEAEPAPVEGMEHVRASRTPDLEGVRLEIGEGPEVLVDGRPIEGEAVVGRLRPDGTPIVACGPVRLDVFSLDGSDYELRIYDERSEKLAEFDRIERYDYDPELVVEGEFRALGEREQVAWEFTRPEDVGHTKTVPGVVALPVGDETRELQGFLDGDHLVIVFADATTGAESYAPGRFLRIPAPRTSGAITVDFNRAFIPPCGFSDFYSCPIPPAANKLPIPVRAGERRVAWREEAGA